MKRLNLAFTRSGTFVMTGGVSVDVPEEYSAKQLETMLMNREFAEFLPLEIEYDEDDWEFEEIDYTEED